MTTQPSDPEGGALLWSVNGTLVIRKTPSGYHIMAEEHSHAGYDAQNFDAQQDDMEAFLEQLSNLVRGY